MHFFPQKSRPFVSCRPRNTGRQRRFTVKIKQIKRSDMVTFLFSVHTVTEVKQYAGPGRAEPGLEPGRWIFQPGAPWSSAATDSIATVAFRASLTYLLTYLFTNFHFRFVHGNIIARLRGLSLGAPSLRIWLPWRCVLRSAMITSSAIMS